MGSFILKGDICYSESKEKMNIQKKGYLVIEDGKTAGVFDKIPIRYRESEVVDYSGKLILPGLTDLHIHAPQYAFRGIGMDKELLDWLNSETFKEERKYENLDYAKKAYEIFAEAMKKSATTRACVFSTLHVPATMELMDRLEETGIITYVGKVNMDRNSPVYLTEKTEASLEKTEQWIRQCKGRYRKTFPILTPRFIPACSDRLMRGMKEIQNRYRLPLQSHLSENAGEISWVKELCPKAAFYGEAYDNFGLFGKEEKAVMAHCIFSSEEEIELIKKRNVFIAHCPQSNTNLSSGIAPIKKYMEKGLKIGLGSDVAGGTTESVFRAMADAIQVSKLYWRLVDRNTEPLTVEEAFYLGTRGGGEFFGKAGSFEPGFEADVIVIDDSRAKHPQPLDVRQRVERLIYLSAECELSAKYVRGERVL